MIREPIGKVKTYAMIWAALLGLLALSLASAYVKMGVLNTAVNLGIAVAKALLVMAFFMHLRSGNAVLRIVAAAGFFWLSLLLGLAFTDFVAR